MAMDQVFTILDIALKVSLVIFMAGNLLDMGLKLKLEEAIGGLKNVRFVVLSVLWGFVLCPALGYFLAKVIPLAQPYAIGMVLLGMVPGGPFLPTVADKARGDMGCTAAFTLLASVLTVVYMPFAVPIIVKGLTADPWTIAKPLLFFLVVPLAVGMVIRRASAPVAFGIEPFVRKTTDIATLVMLAICIVIYGKGFLNAVGTYAIGTQILFFAAAIGASYYLSPGLTQGQKSVLSLGMSTRQLGAAFAPLFAISGVDQRALVMVALGVPMQTILSLLAARWFARHASAGKPAAVQTAGRTM